MNQPTLNKPEILNEEYEGVIIGKSLKQKSLLAKIILGVPFAYAPIIFSMPFVLVGVFCIRTHLFIFGARNVKKYSEFVPAWASYRHTYKNQPVSSTNPLMIGHYKWLWIFSCKMYCPMSIALLRYYVYLVKILENWWCPFNHSRKPEYADAKIDKSYWHLYPETEKLLHEEDRENPIWNKDAK